MLKHVNEKLKRKKLPTIFPSELFQPHDAFKLFTHLCVIALLNEGQSQSKDQQSGEADLPTRKASNTSNQKYLMPCLLKDLTDIRRLLPQSSVPVFVVRFSDDCMPNSTFVGSITCLLSAHAWEVCQKEDGTPQLLTHNIASLHDPTMPAQVTYINTTQHFELHVSCLNTKAYASIFPQIRNTILSAIHHTFSVMRFKSVTIQDAFLCEFCPSKSIRHAATLHHLQHSSFLKCTITGCDCEVDASHKIWMQAEPSGQTTPSIAGGSVAHPVTHPISPLPDLPPTMTTLTCFKTSSGSINVAERVKSKTFGIQPLEDATETITDA